MDVAPNLQYLPIHNYGFLVPGGAPCVRDGMIFGRGYFRVSESTHDCTFLIKAFDRQQPYRVNG